MNKLVMSFLLFVVYFYMKPTSKTSNQYNYYLLHSGTCKYWDLKTNVKGLASSMCICEDGSFFEYNGIKERKYESYYTEIDKKDYFWSLKSDTFTYFVQDEMKILYLTEDTLIMYKDISKYVLHLYPKGVPDTLLYIKSLDQTTVPTGVKYKW